MKDWTGGGMTWVAWTRCDCGRGEQGLDAGGGGIGREGAEIAICARTAVDLKPQRL